MLGLELVLLITLQCSEVRVAVTFQGHCGTRHGGENSGLLPPLGAPARAVGMRSAVRKRTWKRVLNRAVTAGHAWHRGRLVTKAQATNLLNSKGSQKQHVLPHSGRGFSTSRCKPGESKRAGRFRYFCWNAGGLAVTTLDTLYELFQHHAVDIAVIQETRWSHDSEWCKGGYRCVHSASRDVRGQAGVLTCVRCGLCAAADLRFAPVYPGRLLHVRFAYKNTHMDVVNVYQHYVEQGRGLQRNLEAEARTERREQLLHALAGLLGSIPFRHHLLVAGDFNGCLSSCSSLVGPAVQFNPRRGIDDQLQSMIESFRLCCLNTWMAPRHFSNQGPRGNRSVIDFVMIRAEQTDPQSRHAEYLYDAPVFDGAVARHIPIMGTIPVLWKCWLHSRKPSSPKFAVDRFLDDANSNAPSYQLYMRDLNEHAANIKSTDEVDSLLRKLAHYHYPLERHNPKQQLDGHLRGQVHRGWELLRELRSQNGTSVRSVFCSWSILCRLLRHRRRHHKEHRSRKRAQLDSLIAEAAVAASQGRQRDLHRIVRKLSPKTRHSNMSLRDPGGWLLSPEAEKDAILKHMLSLFHDSQAILLEPRHLQELPFTEADLHMMIKRTPARKAVPPGCCPSAFVKHSVTVLAPILYTLLKQEWEHRDVKINEAWKTSWLCWIPKPLKPLTSMSSYRGISLQDVVGKSVLKTITFRAREQCHSHLLEWPQYGYMQGRSTADAILRVLLHESAVLKACGNAALTPHQRKQGLVQPILVGGLQLCLDISMAFDRVSRLVLLEAMQQAPLTSDVLALYNNWHINTKYCSGDISVNANRGVRQGCVAAPLIWVLYTMYLMQRLSLYIPLICVLTWLTMFADDMHWGQIFHGEEELAEVLRLTRIFLDFLASFGVVVNMQKSAVLLMIRGKSAAKWQQRLLLTIEGQKHLRLPSVIPGDASLNIPVVKEHTYLGIKLGYAYSQKATFRFRASLARGNFIRLRKWWGGKFPLAQRVRLWKQVIWPSLTYGLWDMGLTLTGQKRFSTLVYRQWRHIAHSPVHLTRESNANLSLRLGMPPPLTLLAIDVCGRWLRRIDHLAMAPPHDIQHVVLGQCVREGSQSTLHSWLRVCLRTCFCAPEIDRELYKRLPELAAFFSITDWQEANAETVATEQAQQGAADTGMTCSICQQQFAHQMALRRHIRAVHADCVPDKVVFDVRLHALGGLPTCRFCKFQFRYWQGLRNHIENRVCAQEEAIANQLLEVHSHDDLPVSQVPEVIELVSEQGVVALADKPLWCQRLIHHCCLCNKWIDSSQGLGYHLSTHDQELAISGRVWARNHIRSKVFCAASPCQWCGQSFAQSTFHKCPVIIQLGILHHFLLDHGRQLPSHIGRTGLQDVWGSSAECGQEADISRQHRERTQEGQGKHITREQAKGQRQRRRAKSTQSLHGDGTIDGEARGCHKPYPIRHHILDVLGHLGPNVEFDAGHIQEMEVGARKRHTGTIVHSEDNFASECHDGTRECALPVGRPGQGQSHQALHGQEHPGCPGQIHQEEMESKNKKGGDGRASTRHCRSDQDHTAAGASIHDERPCHQISQHTSTCRRVRKLHPSVSVGAQLEARACGPVLHRPYGALRDECLRTGAMQTSQVNPAAVAVSSRYTEADDGSYPEEIEGLEQVAVDQTSCATTAPSSSFVATRVLSSTCALHIWKVNGFDHLLAPQFYNPNVLCYANAVVSCLLICRDRDPDGQHEWGVLNELFRLAIVEHIGELLTLECLRPVFQTWPSMHSQHDAKEFLDHLRPYVPLLGMIAVESRLQLPEGIMRQHEEFRLVAPLSQDTAVTLQQLVLDWHVADAGLKGVQGHPPFLLLTAPRFDYEAGGVRRRGGRISCEPGWVNIPCFTEINSLALNWREYKVLCCILHRGPGLDSGHYIYLALGDGGYILGDDHRPATYYAMPTDVLSSEIYIIFLQAVDA